MSEAIHWTEWSKKCKEAENKIADLKANCDLAIEGREVKIKELENENKKLESDFRICEKNADTYYDQLTKAKEIIKELINIINYLNEDEYGKEDFPTVHKAEQFLKENE